MRSLALALIVAAVPLAAGADEVPAGKKSTRPCPALLIRIDRWLGELGQEMPEKRRRALCKRLANAGRAAVSRIAGSIPPTYAALELAQKQNQVVAAQLKLGKLLDLIELLGRSRSADAYPSLVRAAGNAGWTETLRKRAIAALGELSDPRALGVLKGLMSSSPGLAYAAGKAIMAIERFEAVPYWIELLDSRKLNLSTGSHELLKKWSGEKYRGDRVTWARFFKQLPEGFKRLPGYKPQD